MNVAIVSDYEILVCGTGIGMSIVVNRNKIIRAAIVGDVLALKNIDAWLDAEF